MNKELFVQKAAALTKDALSQKGIDVDVEVNSVIKANDREYTGLCFHRDGQASAPVFYLDDAYELDKDGDHLNEYVGDLVEAFERADGNRPVQKTEDIDLDRMKDRLSVMVLDPSLNQKYLSDKVWMATGDGLALVCDVEMRSDKDVWFAVVTKEQLIMSDMGKEELFRTAIQNAERNDAASLIPLDALVGLGEPADLLGDGSYAAPMGVSSPMVLSTRSKYFGSVAMYYEGVQKRIAEVLGEGYYALPSSRHEFIIVPDSFEPDREGLLRMVRDANDTVVSDGDKLSYRVFHYEKERERLVGFDGPEKNAVRDLAAERG